MSKYDLRDAEAEWRAFAHVADTANHRAWCALQELARAQCIESELSLLPADASYQAVALAQARGMRIAAKAHFLDWSEREKETFAQAQEAEQRMNDIVDAARAAEAQQ